MDRLLPGGEALGSGAICIKEAIADVCKKVRRVVFIQSLGKDVIIHLYLILK